MCSYTGKPLKKNGMVLRQKPSNEHGQSHMHYVFHIPSNQFICGGHVTLTDMELRRTVSAI